MSYKVPKQDLFRWKRLARSEKSAAKVQLNNGDINLWMKRVEQASELAVAEVFSQQRARPGTRCQAVALQSTDQLQDHDEAYSEAQSLLSDWMNKKLRLELEMEGEDEEREDELICSSEMDGPKDKAADPVNYQTFDDMYSHLVREEETFVVNNFLHDLMEAEVLDPGTVEDLRLDPETEERKKKKGRDPAITIELRHRQVKENRARKDAERVRRRRAEEVRREAWEEAQRAEQEAQRRRRQEVRRQEEQLQQEMVRLRREMAETRSTEQLARHMERERLVKERDALNAVAAKPAASLVQKQQDTQLQLQQQHRLQQVQARVHVLNLQCVQRYFSAWYSVLLEKRVRLGKAAALCDWRRQLRAWRAWRALVWAKREEREAQRTEEALRQHNRNCQTAEENDRRRLLRRCFNDWRVWGRMESERRELLAQQVETRHKMAALISAAASGTLGMERRTPQPITASPEAAITNRPETVSQQLSPPASAPASSARADGVPRAEAPPTQPWQVTRRHTALSPTQLRQLLRGRRLAAAPCGLGTEARGGRYEHRHADQRRTIEEQRRLLREQQEQIAQLQDRQNILELRQRAERIAQVEYRGVYGAHPDVGSGGAGKLRPQSVSRARNSLRETPNASTGPPHPSVRAMEERAQQRAERRREVEEMKRKRDEERLAEMKAAAEERQRQEEEEKRLAVEKKREEKRRQLEREQQRRRRLEREQHSLRQADQHYRRSLLLHHGLAPWQRLLHLCHASVQRAGEHYRRALQLRCLLSWLQVAAEAQAAKRASAEQLYQQILQRRVLSGWRGLMQQRVVLAVRADRFWRSQTLRRFFTAFLNHVTEEKLMAWDREQLAEEHSARRAVRCCFISWRRLPGLQREERLREARREQLRRRVAEILPDFRSSPRETAWSPALPH